LEGPSSWFDFFFGKQIFLGFHRKLVALLLFAWRKEEEFFHPTFNVRGTGCQEVMAALYPPTALPMTCRIQPPTSSFFCSAGALMTVILPLLVKWLRVSIGSVLSTAIRIDF
jgi:hypothetical protein